MAWTDEMITTLKKLWDEGVSTGEIGKRLGVTKNSVVGKVHRLKLDGRPSPIKRSTNTDAPKKEVAAKETKKVEKTVKESKAEKEVIKPQQKVMELEKPKKVEKLEPAKTKMIEHSANAEKAFGIKESTEIAPSKRADGGYSLIELGLNSCRWPIGDPKDENFHFCGKKTKTGQTYCQEHSEIAYVKIIKK